MGSKCLVLGIFEFVVGTLTLGHFPLTIPLKAHLGLFFKPLLSPLNLLTILSANFIDLSPMLLLEVDLLILNLIAEKVLLEKAHLLIDVPRFF